MSSNWDAKLYTQFLDARTRPARDLLAAIPDHICPKLVYDLGCGPGNSSILLKQRWPQATVIGIDSSPNMLADARIRYPDINFIEEDIFNFSPKQPPDIIFSNASLQWLSNHDDLFPRLVSQLKSGGILAIQMPNNFHAPTHQSIRQVLEHEKDWTPLLEQLRYGKLDTPCYDPRAYYDLLVESGLISLKLWESVYQQEMANHKEIFHWVKGTALRPILKGMNDQDKKRFERAYIEKITQAYPVQVNGLVLLPFQRFFIVGLRAASR